MAELWMNWARQQRCEPSSIERPDTEAELAEVVVRAAERGLTVRAAGAGHSFTDICLTDGCLVDVRRLDRVLDVDRSSGLVRVQAGITIRELARELDAHGLALENQGDIDVQAIAGALATATHGTGTGFANLSSRVRAARLATASGEVVELTPSSDADGLLAARVSVGALGIISELTLEAVPAFRIHRIDEPRPRAEVLAELDELAQGHDHFEVFAFPYGKHCLTLTSQRTYEPPRPRSRLKAWVSDELIANRLLGVLMRVGRAFPRATPFLGRALTRVLSREEHLDASHRIYAHERRVRFTEMEYAIPRAHAREAVERVLELVEERRIPVNFPIEIRFAAGDDAFLSTAHERDTAYVAVHQFVGMEYESYFRAVEAIMDDYDGRPHWGKRHFQTAESLAPRYSGWDRFQAVRARLDPNGTFTNDYVRRTLGPVGAPVDVT